jgi:carboxylesterase type B
LDIFVPENATAKSSLPVKVWAYGGGNDGGALTYPLYNACHLASDSIVVKFNYRLGPLGFLALPDAGIRANMAIQDYLAALTWVKRNIGAFGGNPSKVMLFGQSSGADDTFVVSTLPEAKSLISAAVMESGGGLDMIPYETAKYTGRSFAKTLNCSSEDVRHHHHNVLRSVAILIRVYLVILPTIQVCQRPHPSALSNTSTPRSPYQRRPPDHSLWDQYTQHHISRHTSP